MKVCIVDCYSDEPAGLGVPPYIGTTPRYVFGAVLDGGGTPNYMNIDDVRSWWGGDHQPLNLTKEPLEVHGILSKYGGKTASYSSSIRPSCLCPLSVIRVTSIPAS